MVADLIALDDASRIWIYQADRKLEDKERHEMQAHLYQFLGSWTAHSSELKAYGNLFHSRFLTIFADETQAAASGCSIDKSVHFVEQLGSHYKVDFFNRMLFSYFDEEEYLHTHDQAGFKAAYANGSLTNDTLVFDHMMKTKGQFLTEWVKPLKDSWLKRFV